MRLNITLAVADLESTARFYRELLQLSIEALADSHGEERILLVTLDNINVVFQRCEEMEGLHPSLLQNLTRYNLGVGLQLELNYPDLDDLFQRIKYQQWPIVYELDDQEHHRREVWLHDPDGYLLVLNEENC